MMSCPPKTREEISTIASTSPGRISKDGPWVLLILSIALEMLDVNASIFAELLGSRIVSRVTLPVRAVPAASMTVKVRNAFFVYPLKAETGGN